MSSANQSAHPCLTTGTGDGEDEEELEDRGEEEPLHLGGEPGELQRDLMEEPAHATPAGWAARPVNPSSAKATAPSGAAIVAATA